MWVVIIWWHDMNNNFIIPLVCAWNDSFEEITISSVSSVFGYLWVKCLTSLLMLLFSHLHGLLFLFILSSFRVICWMGNHTVLELEPQLHLGQESTNFFCLGLACKYFQFCGKSNGQQWGRLNSKMTLKLPGPNVHTLYPSFSAKHWSRRCCEGILDM